MKRIISFVLLGILFLTPLCFADDVVTDVGQVPLTENQLLNYAPFGIWKNFSYVEGEVLAVSSETPSEADISAFTKSLRELSDVTPQRVYIEQFNMNKFWGQVLSTIKPEAYYALAQYARTVELLWEYPNIPGIRSFLQGLVSQTINGYTILQSDMDLVVAAFKAQGVEI